MYVPEHVKVAITQLVTDTFSWNLHHCTQYRQNYLSMLKTQFLMKNPQWSFFCISHQQFQYTHNTGAALELCYEHAYPTSRISYHIWPYISCHVSDQATCCKPVQTRNRRRLVWKTVLELTSSWERCKMWVLIEVFVVPWEYLNIIASFAKKIFKFYVRAALKFCGSVGPGSFVSLCAFSLLFCSRLHLTSLSWVYDNLGKEIVSLEFCGRFLLLFIQIRLQIGCDRAEHRVGEWAELQSPGAPSHYFQEFLPRRTKTP